MSALANRQNPSVTGAVMVNGQMLCFDARDYDLSPGTEAVVIGRGGAIYVAKIADDHPEQKARMARSRSAVVPYVSGRHPAGTPEFLMVKVLGRYIPKPVSAQSMSRGVRSLETA